MFVPAVSLIASTGGVALLRRSGDYPSVLRAVLKTVGFTSPVNDAWGFDSPAPQFF